MKTLTHKQVHRHTQSSETYSFKQTWGVDVQRAAALNPLGGAVLAGLLVHHVAGHKHGDEVAGGEAALVGLKGRREGGARNVSLI